MCSDRSPAAIAVMPRSMSVRQLACSDSIRSTSRSRQEWSPSAPRSCSRIALYSAIEVVVLSRIWLTATWISPISSLETLEIGFVVGSTTTVMSPAATAGEAAVEVR